MFRIQIDLVPHLEKTFDYPTVWSGFIRHRDSYYRFRQTSILREIVVGIIGHVVIPDDTFSTVYIGSDTVPYTDPYVTGELVVVPIETLEELGYGDLDPVISATDLTALDGTVGGEFL